ncbi:MAG: 3'-5' exoribonuclease YhaM family protein [Candidatus Promineifilaceae bacterium]
MKNIYVSDLTVGDDLLNEPFLLQDVIRRETKDGRPYLLTTFRDKTGQLNGVFWDVPEDVEAWIRPGIVTLVTGRVSSYKNSLQINATDLNPSMTTEMDDYLPASSRSSKVMIAELRALIAGLDEPWRQLVSKILLDEAFLPRFANAPAARVLHHAYVGGLLEHSLSMAGVAEFLAGYYPYVNKSLLLAGVLLHDLGKAMEYDTEAGFEFTDDGRLVGHIVRAVVIIEKAAAELGDISESDLRQLVHLVASHHGVQEWGSPVVPKTLEAVLLHQIDMIDSRVQGYFDHLRNNGTTGAWSSKPSLMFNTDLRKPDGFE